MKLMKFHLSEVIRVIILFISRVTNDNSFEREIASFSFETEAREDN